MAHITIGVTATRTDYVAVGSQTAFTIPFEFFDEDDLAVYQNGSLLTKTTHYTITPVTTSEGGFDGGTVTLVTGATLDDEVAIVLNMPATRDTDFPTSGPFNITTLNTWIDKMILLVKQVNEKLARSLSFPASESNSAVLASIASRGGKLMGFDNAGDMTYTDPDTLSLATLAAAFDFSVDTFSGDGATTTFTLSGSPGAKANTDIFIDGVHQNQSVYALAGGLITFTAAPPTGTSNIEVRYGQAVASVANTDDVWMIVDDSDVTKVGMFQLSGVSTGRTRVLTWPDFNGVIATLAGTETLTNKSITSPDIDGGSIDNAVIDGRDVSVDGTKLDTVETNADVTDTTNVTAAGALMDSELTNITAVKALDQGVATTDTPTFAGLVTAGNVDGRDVSVDGAKLDGIEAGADVTDTTNVTAAGALMDSELTNIAAVKALDQNVATGDSPTFAGLTATTADINGGTIDGAVIGGASAAAGTFTTVTTSGNAGVGTATPASALNAAFRVLEVSSTLGSSVRATDTANSTNIEIAAGAGSTYVWNSTNTQMQFGTNNTSRMTLTTAGNLQMANAAGPALLNEAASSTNPTLVPARGVPATGFGSNGANTVYGISNGTENFRFGNGAVAVTGTLASSGTHTVGTNSSGNSATLQQASGFQFKLNGDTASQLGTVSWVNNSGATTANIWATGDNSSSHVFRIKSIGRIDLIPNDVGITGAVGKLTINGNTGSTGGTGSAGSGNQYVELTINGSRYKLLHDGTI